MSLSSRKWVAFVAAARGPSAGGALALLASHGVQAQQLLFNPNVQTTAEWDSNRLLSTGAHPPTSEWFQALFGADLLRNTARSSLDLQPEVILQKSTLKSVDTFEARVTGKYSYLTQRSEYGVVAEFLRQDSYNSEYGLVTFNPLNPDAPATQGSGHIVTGITRDTYQISPALSHTFTERLQSELNLNFLAVRFSTQIPEQLVSFNAPSVAANLVWSVSQRGKLAIGPYYSQYNPIDPLQEGTLKSRSYGADISYRYQTTRTTNSSILLKLGRDEQDQFIGPAKGTNTWGLEWKGTYLWETSEMQFAVGRFLQPSTVGGETGLYQIRAQYTRRFSQSLTGVVGARLTREVGIGQNFGDRDRGFGEVSLSKTLTREFFLTGGYRWLLQSLPVVNAAGEIVRGPTGVNHAVYLTIGWRPLESR